MIFPRVEQYFEELKEVKPDALIISDPGVFAIAKKILPDMELSYQYPGQQYELRDLFILGTARGKAGGDCQGAVPAEIKGNQGEDSGGHGD